MKARPITICNNDNFPLSVLKKDFLERNIPAEYLVGILKNVFSAQEKNILKNLPSLETLDEIEKND